MISSTLQTDDITPKPMGIYNSRNLKSHLPDTKKNTPLRQQHLDCQSRREP